MDMTAGLKVSEPDVLILWSGCGSTVYSLSLFIPGVSVSMIYAEFNWITVLISWLCDI